jgi:hypothetical protein
LPNLALNLRSSCFNLPTSWDYRCALLRCAQSPLLFIITS